MKKILALLMVLALAFTLVACRDPEPTPTPEPDPTPTPEPDPTPVEKDLDPYDTWKLLNGIWGRDDDMSNFIIFSADGTTLHSNYGAFFSDYVVSAELTKFSGKGTKANFTSVPSWYDMDKEATVKGDPQDYDLDFSGLADGYIMVTDQAGDGKVHKFRYLAETWDKIDTLTLRYPQGVGLNEALDYIDGVYCTNQDDQDVYFFVTPVTFEDDGSRGLYTGIPFSGYGLAGRITGFERDVENKTFIFNLFFPGWEPNDLDDGREDMTATAYVDYSLLESDGVIIMNNVANDGKTVHWKWCARNMDELDIDKMIKDLKGYY